MGCVRLSICCNMYFSKLYCTGKANLISMFSMFSKHAITHVRALLKNILQLFESAVKSVFCFI